MEMSRFLSNLWKRKDYLDKRTRHQDMDDICGGLSSGGFTMSGIYLIGYGDRIVYIGQSIGMGALHIGQLNLLQEFILK